MTETYKADFKYQRFLQEIETKVRPSGATTENGNKNWIGVAIFGLGRIGTIHLRTLLCEPTVRVLYAADSLAARLTHLDQEWALRQHRGTKLIAPESAAEVWNDPEVDAVLVCTPTASHEDLVSGALRARKAVLCEKPLAASSSGIRRLYKLAAEMQQPLLCAFNRRFDPTYRQIYERVRGGEIGKQLQVIKSTARDSPRPPIEFLRTSGGIFHDCGIHDIDLVCWLMGDFPVSVTCHASAFNPEIGAIPDFDTVAITMKFASGCLGMIDLSRSAVYGYDQRLEVFGSGGMLSGNGIRPTSVVRDSPSGTTAVPICYSFASRYADAYREEVEHFLRVVRDRLPGSSVTSSPEVVAVSGRETLAACRISTACSESAHAGGKTIQLDWSPGWEERLQD